MGCGICSKSDVISAAPTFNDVNGDIYLCKSHRDVIVNNIFKNNKSTGEGSCNKCGRRDMVSAVAIIYLVDGREVFLCVNCKAMVINTIRKAIEHFN